MFKLSVFKISLVITLIFMAFAFLIDQKTTSFTFIKSLALKTNVDAKFYIRGKRPISNDIVIVAIDDKSLEQFGRWPWNRTLLADGLKKIAPKNTQDKPKVISLDMVFSEQDPNSQAPTFQKLQTQYQQSHTKDSFYETLSQQIQRADTDQYFSKTIHDLNKTTPIMLGYFFYFSKKDIEELKTDWEKEFEHIFDSKITAKISTVRYPPEEIPTGMGAKSSIKPYAQATSNHGFFDISSDIDGTIRKTHLIGKYKNTLFPSFALKTVALALHKEIVVQFGSNGIENIFLENEFIPTNLQGEFWINYVGPSYTFPMVSFADIYNGKIPPETFKDKIVLMGVTAKAVGDIRVSPYDNAHPGIEINATIIENLLHKHYLGRPPEAVPAEMLFILIIGLFLGILFTYIRSVWCGTIALGMIILYAVCDQKFFFEKGIIANFFTPGFHLLFVFMTTNAFKYFGEEKKSREIKSAFQRYVSPAVVNEILKHPTQLSLGGEKRKLTVLFSDIRGFTTLSESISPEKLTHLLNIYLTDMTDIVFKYQGMLDKYVGDELMALYGAPLKTESHVLDACQSAIEMIQKLEDVRQKWSLEGVSHLNIGVGIHTGDMIVGNMGSTKIFDYTVIGDSVNLGSRLEGTNKQYGTHIIISQDVYEQLQGKFTCRELDYIRARGKTKPVQIYELCSNSLPPELLEEFSKGLSFYRKTQWAEALEIFETLLKKFPTDGPTKTFLERCKLYGETPPASNWDGVFTMQTK
ncbi:MAG: hypothetical protein A2Z91_08435 [Deltaproteobacteria bacterium GWA2_38_16]|nr:MAG: hypothetical protein A2Z91_08435 [Deltaproteobacteria bacterium GWA2_38_16]OGQ03822.1 MAG: hypothetical protein A3D19_07000 [Deltaproteobacteria bacterium RIFCSPHIGHO2_02_FULL_38_15]OGQ31518.1 MAG: hypothetical protein A3A72_09310 [Deltaproteobacteria bacterium RIFCSPLOWO2_01_FULL_38_9]OGQ60988.1 MAG: hypothetical protein A3G92_00540 [Deltaproteobacteria bacterium RIFCSPLOWO2_12_FULL_38_8]HBQ20865.1 hypothetical protein [Deltaproteobacteria bacterium]